MFPRRISKTLPFLSKSKETRNHRSSVAKLVPRGVTRFARFNALVILLVLIAATLYSASLATSSRSYSPDGHGKPASIPGSGHKKQPDTRKKGAAIKSDSPFEGSGPEALSSWTAGKFLLVPQITPPAE